MADIRISEELLAKVEPEWREDILKFIETGEGRQEFLDHLDSNEGETCRNFIEAVFNFEMKAFQDFAAKLRNSEIERIKRREEALKNCGFWKRLWYKLFGQP